MITVNKFVNANHIPLKNLSPKRSFASKPKNIRDLNYQYLQRSKVPTMHFQKSLPRLPIPELPKSGERYLNALRPLLTSSQYDEAQRRTNDFIAKDGKLLQAKLVAKDKANKHTSYISDYWFDLYLRDRVPLPINYNPLIVFQNDVRAEYNDQLIRSANLLTSAVRFMLSLREQILEPEVFHLNPKKSNTPLFRTVSGLLPEAISWYGAYLFKAFPLDMSQFVGLFGATRIPLLGKDKIFRDPTSKHVLVQRNGNFYIFDVLDSDVNCFSNMITVNKFVNANHIPLKNLSPKRSFASKPKNIRDLNYQYLQRSKVPTMHFQKSLPRLPIPELPKSGERYLNALRPLLTSSQYDEAQRRTNDFIAKDGKLLQAKLVAKDKANKHTSYISDYWFDLYLRDRVPLPINYNPLIVFQNDVRAEYNDQLIRSANLLTSAVRFMLSLREQILEPEVFHLNPKKSNTPLFRTVSGLLPEAISWYGAYLFKAFPLDMSQFVGLFGATRIPLLGKDKIFRDPTSKHVLVQRNGNFYIFDVLDSDGNLLSPTELLGNLNRILNDNSPKTEHPLGVLTSQNRDVWAKQRAHLEETGNGEALSKIDSAIFNLVLDDEVILDDKHQIMKHYLHGDGLNRWFDKSFSLIISRDGVSGINFEHSWGDGVAVLRFFEDIYAETTKKPFLHPDSKPADSNISVRKLEFKLDDKSKHFVEKAKIEYRDWYESLSIDYILYEELTKEACKKFKVSPDCVMQLGFQAAYHLLHSKYVGTYESCSTSAFKHGRTETMRPCTDKTKAFCDGMHIHKSSYDELRSIMQECSSYHSELVKQAAMGQGFDRHLFALMKIAEDNNLQRPELFDSYEYKFLNKSILSTSTLSSPSVLAGGFGPVLKEGFGIGYSAFADKLGAAVTSYKAHNDSSQFIEALHQSFKDITKILSG